MTFFKNQSDSPSQLEQLLSFTCVVSLLVSLGCTPPQDVEKVPNKFKLPSIDRLFEIDETSEYSNKIVEIECVISPKSQGGWVHPRTDDYEIHRFELAAWRIPGQPLATSRLDIIRPFDPSVDPFSDFPALSIHRLKVYLSSNKHRAILIEKSSQLPEMTQLKEIAEQLTTPVQIQTERFGDVSLNRKRNYFEGSTTWGGNAVSTNFGVSTLDELQLCLQIANRLWEEEDAWKEKVELFVVQKLLPVKNTSWLDIDEKPYTTGQFRSKLQILSITIEPNKEVRFCFKDGDLFGGHLILVSGSLDGGLTDVEIAG